MLTRTRSSSRRVLGPVLAAALALGALAGCGTDDKSAEEDESAKPSPSATATEAAPYLPVPGDVTLTEPGTALGLGEEGVIGFEQRQGDVAALGVRVDRIERTSFQESFADWQVDAATAARTPYFVRLRITNVTEEDLGGLSLQNILWADDGSTLEVPITYTAQQLRVCSGGPLPTPFATGATADLCLVFYIAPDRVLQSVTFPPPGDLEPVTWSGEVSKVKKPEPTKKKKKKKGKRQ